MGDVQLCDCCVKMATSAADRFTCTVRCAPVCLCMMCEALKLKLNSLCFLVAETCWKKAK